MTFRHPGRVSALIVIDGTCITADPGRVGRAELRMAGAHDESLALREPEEGLGGAIGGK